MIVFKTHFPVYQFVSGSANPLIMSEYPLLDLDSLSDHLKPGPSNIQDDLPPGSTRDKLTNKSQNGVGDFFASSHSDSPSSSSNSSRARRRQKMQETSFTNVHPLHQRSNLKKNKALIKKDAAESSPSISRGCTSSGTDDVSSPSGKQKKIVQKPLPSIRTNKIHDLRVQEESRRIRINEENELRNRSEMSKRRQRRMSGDSADDLEAGRSFTPMSDNMSYRERFRDRFNTVKERAVESLSRPQSRSQSRLKQLMMKPSGSSRMEDLLRQEEEEVASALERHHTLRQHWRELAAHSTEEITAVDGYQFFTEDLAEDLAELGDLPTSPGREVEVLIEMEAEETAESTPSRHSTKKVMTSEYLGFKEEPELTEMVKPWLSKTRPGRFLLKDLYFSPSTRPVSLDEKLEPGLRPRYLEDEGLYVGTKISIPERIKNKMEHRILMTPDYRKWFGEDGELVPSIDPLKAVAVRPIFDEDSKSDFQTEFKPATTSDLQHQYMELGHYILDIDIHTIQFSHHPLFSREHILAQRLKELYVKHKRRGSGVNQTVRLAGRLDALRRARDNLRSTLTDDQDEDTKKKIARYEQDIKETRQQWHNEGSTDKLLMNKLLTTWKDLKLLRDQQGYRNTNIKLSVRKTAPDDTSEEDDRWRANIEVEVEEILEELEKHQERQQEEYKRKHQLWLQKKQKVSKRTVDNEDAIQRISDTESMENSESDSEEINIREPQPPLPFDAEVVRQQVVERFNKNFIKPTEPRIVITLSQSTVPELAQTNSKEEDRRAAAKRCQLFVKLVYNGKEVCRSKAQGLSSKFNVLVAQRFAVRILEWPETLMFEIHEDMGALSKNLLVPEIYLPFPDSYTTVENCNLSKHEFSSHHAVSFNHTGVGSGNAVTPCPDGSSFNNTPLCLYTSGLVACRVGWAVDGRGNVLAPPHKCWSPLREERRTNLLEMFGVGSSGKFDVGKLKEWAEGSGLDPNDPLNASLFELLQHAGDHLTQGPTADHFRLDPLASLDCAFPASDEDNRRLRLLRLRDSGEPEFRGMKMIPLNEKQIPKELFKFYEKRMSSCQHELSDVTYTDPLDGHRAWGRKCLEQVQQRVLKQCRAARQHRRFQDIVSEDHVPDIGTLGMTFMKWLQPKRPLRPVRKERKKLAVQTLSGQDLRIIVNVVRAFEVPVRKDTDSMSTGGSIEGFSMVNVRPFVEVSFRGVTARTTAAEGANPTWNQDLHIPVRPGNGHFSPGSLQAIRDSLYLHLFDEIVVDLIEDDSLRQTNIHQRLERHWLSGMEIPFPTLYFNSRIEGTFKLYSPPVLLGYEREAHRRHFSSVIPFQEPHLPQRDATYITLFITVQPALNPPEPFKDQLESSETPHVEKHLEGWEKEVLGLYPHRKVKTLVSDITGKSVCVTRFIKPLAPPSLSPNSEQVPTADMIARFVSMIPAISGSTFFPGLFDIWLTGDQVLRLLTGDSEDHASLLCSYFLHLGMRAYVLLGSGIPHGFTAYVLVKEGLSKMDHFVWDPTNGQKFNVNDSFCPLQKIFCIFNDENIWANIQPEERPRRTRFDLTKRADWLPAFGRTVGHPVGSIQPDALAYRPTSRQAVQVLQDKIEKRLRDSLMKWRKRLRTQWNRYCVATLRKLLPKLEEGTWALPGPAASPDHVTELQPILASHKVCGFPINMAYSDIEAVSEAVKATGVHCIESEDVEFALAVYIHPYPNDVLSVWIYAASLIRRR